VTRPPLPSLSVYGVIVAAANYISLPVAAVNDGAGNSRTVMTTARLCAAPEHQTSPAAAAVARKLIWTETPHVAIGRSQTTRPSPGALPVRLGCCVVSSSSHWFTYVRLLSAGEC